MQFGSQSRPTVINIAHPRCANHPKGIHPAVVEYGEHLLWRAVQSTVLGHLSVPYLAITESAFLLWCLGIPTWNRVGLDRAALTERLFFTFGGIGDRLLLGLSVDLRA